jgi:putative flavoprotein involved in K+ transport
MVVLEASERAAGSWPHSAGHPRQRDGISGLEWQRGLSSNSLRGVGRDAVRVARHLAAHPTRG